MTRGVATAVFALSLSQSACGTPTAPATEPPPGPASIDARPPHADAGPRAPLDAVTALLPRPPAPQLMAEAMMNGAAWIARTYGPPSAAEVATCEAECGRLSEAANANAARDDLRRLGCARVSCEEDCPVSGVADFRCH